ncbi:hypothetical protein HK101_009594 [Irineochytrium annulatum]|nr:hypothetical protein HK101_009594 [Irineochytrium annulatum]
MFVKRKPKKKAQRIILADDDPDNDNDNEDALNAANANAPPSDAGKPDAVAAAKKPKRKPADAKKAVISFGDDEDDTEAASFKVIKSSTSRKMQRGTLNWQAALSDAVNFSGAGGMSRAGTVAGPTASLSSYSKEDLEILARSQTKRPDQPLGDDPELMEMVAEPVRIPDDSEIHALRQIRVERRKRGAAGGGGAGGAAEDGDFISLNGKPKKANESRLVTEDQEIEGEEAFEDYEEDRITFGNQASKEGEKGKRTKEIQDMLAGTYLGERNEDEDDVLRDWEQQRVRESKGRADPRATNYYKDGGYTALPDVAIPTATRLITSDKVYSRLDEQIRLLETDLADQRRASEHHVASLATSKEDVIKLEADLKAASERYTYFQELMAFMSTLAGFLDAKTAAVTELEKQFHAACLEASEAARIEKFARIDKLLAAFTMWNVDVDMEEAERVVDGAGAANGTGVQHPSVLRIRTFKESVPEKRTILFEDVLKQFRNLDTIRAVFLQWKSRFGADYNRSFAGLGFPSVVALFIRCDLLAWEPFSEPLDISKFPWHRMLEDGQLEDGGEEDTPLLMRAVQKGLFPRVRMMVDTLDVFFRPQVAACAKLLRDLEDYAPLDSKPFQGIVTSVYNHVDGIVVGVTGKTAAVTQTVAASDAMLSARDAWFKEVMELFRNLLLLSPYVGRAAVQTWGGMLINQHVVPLLGGSLQRAEDVDKFEEIMSAIPANWSAGFDITVVQFHMLDFAKKFPK